VYNTQNYCVSGLCQSFEVLNTRKHNVSETGPVTDLRPGGGRHWVFVWKVTLYLRKNSMAWVLERTIPTERPPLVGEVSANFGDRWCRVVSVTDPHGRIIGFLDRSPYFSFQAAPQLYSRGCVDLVPDTLLLRKSGSAGDRTRTSGFVARNSDH
jgi:hypothetical protein